MYVTCQEYHEENNSTLLFKALKHLLKITLSFIIKNLVFDK